MKPLKLLKYCHKCEKVTDWLYDRVVGHSYCEVCGGRFGDGLSCEQVNRWREAELGVTKDKLSGLVVAYLNKRIVEVARSKDQKGISELTTLRDFLKKPGLFRKHVRQMA